jgi:hypothetical protein
MCYAAAAAWRNFIIIIIIIIIIYIYIYIFFIFYQGFVLTRAMLVTQASQVPAHNNVTVV